MPWNARAEVLLACPALRHAVRLMAGGFVSVRDSAPRASSLFATQQRWLMSHVALALHFTDERSGSPRFTRQNFAKNVTREKLASRNTALAFLQEAMQYGIVGKAEASRSVTASPVGGAILRPSCETIVLLGEWYLLHLRALDDLDRRNRCGRFVAHRLQALSIMEPLVCRSLLGCVDLRGGGPAYALFGWMDQGGLVMDRMIAGIDFETAADDDMFLTDVTSISELARTFNLARSHMSRKMREGEQAGLLRWSGRPGHSRLQISFGFVAEYLRAQALKLAIIDIAFDAFSDSFDDADLSCVKNGQ